MPVRFQAVDGAKAATVKSAVDMVASKLGVPIDACFATQKDHFRKPSGGMWAVIDAACFLDKTRHRGADF